MRGGGDAARRLRQQADFEREGAAGVGLTAVFIAWFPAALERAGLRRLAAWLRTWWDEDAR